MAAMAVAAPTATAAFVRKLHSPQGKRFRRRWCGCWGSCRSGGGGGRDRQVVLVLVATVVLVVMDPVDPCLDSCVRRRSRRRSHSHQSRNGAPVAVVVVVAEVVVAEAMQGEVVVGCSFCVVMGATRKKLSPPKTVSWEHLFLPVATQYISWEVRFTHRNERRPRLKSISVLAPSGLPPQWKGRNFLKVHQSDS